MNIDEIDSGINQIKKTYITNISDTNILIYLLIYLYIIFVVHYCIVYMSIENKI